MAQEPTRTCTGCRKQRPRRELLRFVAHGEQAVADPLQRSAGRGVYLCPRWSCFERSARRGGLARGLRRPIGAAAPEQLAAATLQTLEQAVASLSAQALADGRARRDAHAALAVIAASRTAARLGALTAQIEELKRCGGAHAMGGRESDAAARASGPPSRQGGTDGERSDL